MKFLGFEVVFIRVCRRAGDRVNQALDEGDCCVQGCSRWVGDGLHSGVFCSVEQGSLVVHIEDEFYMVFEPAGSRGCSQDPVCCFVGLDSGDDAFIFGNFLVP